MEKGREGHNTRQLYDALCEYREQLWMDDFIDVQVWFIEPGRWKSADDFQLQGVRPYAIGVL